MERVQEAGVHGGRWEWRFGALRGASGGWSPLGGSGGERARARLVGVSGDRRAVRGVAHRARADGRAPEERGGRVDHAGTVSYGRPCRSLVNRLLVGGVVTMKKCTI